MSDSPLADWLRSHGDGEDRDRGDGAADGGHPVDRAAGVGVRETPEGAHDGWSTEPARSHPAPWEDPLEPEAGRPRRLVALAVLPWVVVAALCALAFTALSPGGSADRPPAGADEATGRAQDPGTTVEQQAVGQVGPLAGGGLRPAAAERRLRAAAALAVRMDGAPAAGERRYVDLVATEAVTWTGTTAIVTVTAIVLEGTGDTWDTARPARFAVPLRMSDGRAVALGDPWALPAPEQEVDAGTWELSDADTGAVAEALQTAGYEQVDVEGLEARPDLGGVVRARVRAQAPGEQAVRSHRLWLATVPAVAVLGLQEQ